jgi:nucleoside-diphosphate-sugar epimerase
MRILVTGANGFLGSHVAEELARQGQDLRFLLRQRSRLLNLDGVLYERTDGDVRDEASLRPAVSGVDVVVHVAGLTSALNERAYTAVNAIGTASLARAAVENGVKRFVYVSSLAAQGPSPDGRPVPDALPRPISAYGRSKLAGELAVLGYRDRMDVVVVRAPVVYGPRDRGLLTLFKLAKRRVLPLYGDGKNQISWVYATDAARAIALTAQHETAAGEIYTLSDGAPHSWLELAMLLKETMGRRMWLARVPGKLYAAAGFAAGAMSTVIRRPLPLSSEKVVEMRERFWLCDHDRITEDLGWKPLVGPREGIGLTLRWYQEQRWL